MQTNPYGQQVQPGYAPAGGAPPPQTKYAAPPPSQGVGIQQGYANAVTPAVPLGITGLPRARPFFPGRLRGGAENGIRYSQPMCGNSCCFDELPGPNIPEHWYDGGMGWVTKYFTDVQPFDWTSQNNGIHVCIVPVVGPDGVPRPCNHQISGTGCCDKSSCWCPRANAPTQMVDHLASHGILPPPGRQWASECSDTTGCCDVLFCTPCIGSRMMMAFKGYANTMSWLWCCVFCLMGCDSDSSSDNSECSWTPPWTMVALLTRYRMVVLNRIDEGYCTTCCYAICCPCCSAAQTYRELSASGVWPGGVTNSEPPTQFKLQPLLGAPQVSSGPTF